MPGVQRQVSHGHPCPDHGGQVADDIGASEQVDPVTGVPDVEHVDPVRRAHRPGVGLRHQGIHPYDLMTRVS